MAWVDYKRVKEQLDIADVLALLDWEATGYDRNGARGPCPVHGSTSAKSRSFAVSFDKHCCQCFRCHFQGNALDLFAACTKLTLREAALRLCEEFDLDPGKPGA